MIVRQNKKFKHKQKRLKVMSPQQRVKENAICRFVHLVRINASKLESQE